MTVAESEPGTGEGWECGVVIPSQRRIILLISAENGV